MASLFGLRTDDVSTSRSVAFIERHVLLAFFGLTYAISWGVWLLEPLVARTDSHTAGLFGLLAPYGPTLAALLLAALVQPERLPRNHSTVRVVVSGAVFAGTLALLWNAIPNIARSPHPWVAAAVWLVVALLPAWLVWNVHGRIKGVRVVLHSLLAWRTHIIWYLAAFMLLPAVSLFGIALLRLLGQPVPPFPRTEPWLERVPLLLITFWGTLLFGGPLGEEAGWRGFALPRLQQRRSPLGASVILGVLWGLWHVPLHLNGFYEGMFPAGFAGIGVRVVSSIGLAIVFTWLYNRTHGNLLLMVLLHTAVNNTFGFWLPIHMGLYVTTAVMGFVMVSVDKMWLPPTMAPSDVGASSSYVNSGTQAMRERPSITQRS